MDFERLYAHLPVFLQNAAVNAQGFKINHWRYGGEYERIFAENLARLQLDPERLRHHQKAKLEQLLKSAQLTPFWRERFADHGVNPGGRDPFMEIQKLPILTKAEVKEHVGKIVNNSFPRQDLISRHTSGTTGSGLVFPGTRISEYETWAVWWRYRQMHGITRDMWCGYFGGRSVVPVKETKPPFWRTNVVGRQILYSAYHLNEKNAPTYLENLRKRKLSWLHGYPSVLALLATYIHDLSLEPPRSLQVITTGAESLSPAQRNHIERAFGAKVVEHYGQAESVANISECEFGSMHVDEDFSLIEFEAINGTPERFRIIGTNWTNLAFPLLRYDTGDVAALDPDAKCACGSNGRIVAQIDGRIEDYLVLPNGMKIGRLDHIFKDCINIREAQIHQSQDGSITFRVVRGRKYIDADEKQLEDEVLKRLGTDVNFNIEYCDEILKTASGKLRFVVSELRA